MLCSLSGRPAQCVIGRGGCHHRRRPAGDSAVFRASPDVAGTRAAARWRATGWVGRAARRARPARPGLVGPADHRAGPTDRPRLSTFDRLSSRNRMRSGATPERRLTWAKIWRSGLTMSSRYERKTSSKRSAIRHREAWSAQWSSLVLLRQPTRHDRPTSSTSSTGPVVQRLAASARKRSRKASAVTVRPQSRMTPAAKSSGEHRPRSKRPHPRAAQPAPPDLVLVVDARQRPASGARPTAGPAPRRGRRARCRSRPGHLGTLPPPLLAPAARHRTAMSGLTRWVTSTVKPGKACRRRHRHGASRRGRRPPSAGRPCSTARSARTACGRQVLGLAAVDPELRQ